MQSHDKTSPIFFLERLLSYILACVFSFMDSLPLLIKIYEASIHTYMSHIYAVTADTSQFCYASLFNFSLQMYYVYC